MAQTPVPGSDGEPVPESGAARARVDLSNLSTPVRILGFVTALAVVFGITLLAGRAVGPINAAPVSGPSTGGHGGGHGSGTPGSGGDGDGAATAHLPGGLQVSQDGYTLRLHHDRFEPAPQSRLDFEIIGPDGAPVTAYNVQHEKELHLIAVRRDFTGFQHVHPTRAAGGTWSIDLDLTPGAWRVFADVAPAGSEPLTLGADVLVAGDDQPAPAPAADVRTATVDGYTVTLRGDVAAGTDSELTLSVSRDGRPVTNLEPYLGAYGHLVALRSGDLAYLHVHPAGHPGDGVTKPGPEITFGTAVPSPGTYRLYLDFLHEGVVRTAEFTVTAPAAGSSASTPKPPSATPDDTPTATPTGGSSEHQH